MPTVRGLLSNKPCFVLQYAGVFSASSNIFKIISQAVPANSGITLIQEAAPSLRALSCYLIQALHMLK